VPFILFEIPTPPAPATLGEHGEVPIAPAPAPPPAKFPGPGLGGFEGFLAAPPLKPAPIV